MWKRVLSILLVLGLVVGIFSGCKSKTATTIKIGLGMPLTGTSGVEGTANKRGAELAVKDVNDAGGINGQMLELVEMDDVSDPKQSANIANLFVADAGIIAAVAGYNSVCVLSAAPIYNKAHLTQIGVGCSSPFVTDAGPYTFRVWNSDIYRASFDLQILLDAGYKKVGIMYQNDDFGRGALKVSQDMLGKLGLKPLVVEGFLLGETRDFNTMITKMKNAGCDSVFCLADEAELAAFCVQVAQQNWHPFLSATGTYNPNVIKLGGQAVEGLVGDAFWDPAQLPANVVSFFDKMNKAYAKNGEVIVADPESPCAYSAIQILAAALKSGAKTREDVNKYLTTLQNFDALVGTISYDSNGDTHIPLVRVVVKGGQYVLYTGPGS